MHSSYSWTIYVTAESNSYFYLLSEATSIMVSVSTKNIIYNVPKDSCLHGAFSVLPFTFKKLIYLFLHSSRCDAAHRSHFWCLQIGSGRFSLGCLASKALHIERCRIHYELPFIMPINVWLVCLPCDELKMHDLDAGELAIF